MLEDRCASPTANAQVSPGAQESAASPKPIENASITAVVTSRSTPYAGVQVTVTGPNGFTATGTTGADGTVKIAVPSNDEYFVAINEGDIPEDMLLPDGPQRRINVLSGDKKALFAVVDRASASPSSAPPATELVGSNWVAYSTTTVPSLQDLQKVLGGDIRTVDPC